MDATLENYLRIKYKIPNNLLVTRCCWDDVIEFYRNRIIEFVEDVQKRGRLRPHAHPRQGESNEGGTP